MILAALLVMSCDGWTPPFSSPSLSQAGFQCIHIAAGGLQLSPTDVSRYVSLDPDMRVVVCGAEPWDGAFDHLDLPCLVISQLEATVSDIDTAQLFLIDDADRVRYHFPYTWEHGSDGYPTKLFSRPRPRPR